MLSSGRLGRSTRIQEYYACVCSSAVNAMVLEPLNYHNLCGFERELHGVWPATRVGKERL